jgi:hypothetical protein
MDFRSRSGNCFTALYSKYIAVGIFDLGHPSWAVTPRADLLALSQPARQHGVDEAAGLVPMEASFFIRGGKRLRLTS